MMVVIRKFRIRKGWNLYECQRDPLAFKRCNSEGHLQNRKNKSGMWPRLAVGRLSVSYLREWISEFDA